jgi:UDP-N-acetylglucosamine--N-acetylmuramyl-(pentapeptide) pyrophosphoryl-undecaprenol N-acetylglucosamine transferase
LSDAGAAAVAPEDELTVDSLAGALNALLRDPDWLSKMAKGARSVARPDAAERLADLVERTALG